MTRTATSDRVFNEVINALRRSEVKHKKEAKKAKARERCDQRLTAIRGKTHQGKDSDHLELSGDQRLTAIRGKTQNRILVSERNPKVINALRRSEEKHPN